MDFSAQSLHKLPVLNFDNSTYKNGDVLQTMGRKLVHDIKCTAISGSFQGSLKRRRTKASPTLLNKKIKVKNSKHQLLRKSSNFKNIKNSLSVCSTFVSQVFQSATRPKPIKKYKAKHKNQRNDLNGSNCIKVLYSSTSCKFNNRHKRRNQKLIDSVYNSEQNCYKNLDRHKFESCDEPNKHSYNNFYSKKESCSIPHQQEYNSNNCGMQYTVIDFPDYDKTDTEVEAINMKRENNCQCQTEDTIRKDEKVAVTMSRLSATLKGGGDCLTDKYSSDPKKKHIRSNLNTDKPKLKFDCRQNIQDLPNDLHENVFNLAKEALKYVVFAVALLAWLPCILVLLSCWLLSYPLRPRYTSRNPKIKNKSQIKIHVRGSKHSAINSIQTFENNNIWEHLVMAVNCAIKSIATSFGAFKSLLHPFKVDAKCSQRCYPNRKRSVNKRCFMSSDPKKKYTLYYSRNKGWVMKSGQLRRKIYSGNQCNRNDIRKARSEHCGNRGSMVEILSQKRCPCFPHCRQPHSKPAGLIHRSHYKIKPCLPTNCYDRHKHVCPNTSGIPVYIRFSNPVLQKYRQANSKMPISQQPLRSQHKCACKSSFTPRISQKTKFKSKLHQYYKKIISNIKTVIDDVETEIWKKDVCCDETYIRTLRRKPLYFMYKICPSFYPFCLTTCKFYENLCHFFLLVISGCIWCPLFAFCYMGYAIFCRCL